MRVRSLCLFALPLLASSLAAQGRLHFLVGFAGDNTNQKNSVPIAGLSDVVKIDGKIDPASAELFAYMKKVFSTNGGRGGFIFDEQHVVEKGGISFYIADAGDGYVLRARDDNANGIIDDNEVKPFTKFGTSSTFGPNTIGVTSVGGKTIVYTGLNRSTKRPTGIWRSEDKNNDGDASDPGETIKLLDASSGITFPGKTGTVALKSDLWERVRVVPRFATVIAFGEAFAADAGKEPADAWCYYAFKENAGKVTSSSVFFNPSKYNGLVTNADIASGALAELDLEFTTAANVKRHFNGFRFCEVDQDGHRNVFPAYYFANTYGPKRGFGSKNSSGEPLHGVVLRGVDLNNDGDLQDKGEVNVFFNGSGKDIKGGAVGTVKVTSWTDPTAGKVSEIGGFVTGLAEGEGVVYLLIENGSRDSVLQLQDKNNNNVIETGEVTVLYETPQPFPPVFSKQYGPYSLELHAIDQSLVVDPMPKGAVPFGKGCPTRAGLDPRVSLTGGVPAVGNASTRIWLKRGTKSSVAILFMGLSNKQFGGVIPLPIKLDGLGLTGCSQAVSNEFVFPFANSNRGSAWAPLPLPNDTRLQGVKLYFQWWNQDRVNAAGWTTSNGLELTIQ